jgi:protein TonB
LKAFGPPPVEEADRKPQLILEAKPCDPEKEECVNRPELVKRQPPSYPGALRATCQEGTVVVSSIIDTDGKIRTPWLRKPPTSPVMALAAMESLRDWRFKPATYKGEPVKVYYELNVNFKVERPCGKRK